MFLGVNAATMDPARGGLENVFLRNVLRHIHGLQRQTQFVVFTHAANHAAFQEWERVCVADEPARGREAPDVSPRRLTAAIAESGVEALFSPLDPRFVKMPVPMVFFVMDLSAYEGTLAQGGWGTGARLKAAKRVCQEAAAFVAPSQYIQDTLLEVLEVPLNKVVVAPLGVEPVFGEPQPGIVQEPYLLCVGDTDESLNLPRLRTALERLRDEIPEHSLVVVGSPGNAEPESWGQSVVRVEECAPAHLAALCQHCDLFVLPSLYAGSGVAVLQAMRAGAQVLASRVGGIPEVAGDVPIYFNPESVGSLMTAIRRGLQKDEAQRDQRIQHGRQVASEYTWENCALKTLSAFKRA